MRIAFVLVNCLALACGATAPNTARARDSIREFNTQTRFGRIEIAAENVAPEYQHDYAEHRRQWNALYHVTDVTLAELKEAPRVSGKPSQLIAIAQVAWYRSDVGEVDGTSVSQTWTARGASYFLTEEHVVGGNPALFDPTPREILRPPAESKAFKVLPLTGETPSSTPPGK